MFRLVPGVKFDIGDSWQGEAAFLYNKVESIDFGQNFVSSDAFKEALASSDPATAYNIFGAGLGINSPSVLDALRVTVSRCRTRSLLPVARRTQAAALVTQPTVSS